MMPAPHPPPGTRNLARLPLPTRRFVPARLRVALVALAAVLGVLQASLGLAQSVVVPAELQAELLGKLASYDRNFAARAGSTARVLLVVNPKDVRSTLSATAMKSALGRVDTIGGLPHTEVIVPFETAASLASRCRAEKVAAVYVTAGFDEQVEGIRAALAGVDVLSIGAVADYVTRGVVLGFDLASGKPKIVVNLPQAKLQNVAFKADVLKLMKVIR